MKKRTYTIIFALISVLLLLSQSAYSQDINANAGVAGAQFLKLNMGARAVAMGGAYCAVSDEINAVYHNPAGLAQLNGMELGCQYSSLYENIQNEAVVFAMELKGGMLAVGGILLHMDDMIGRDWDKTKIDDFTAYDLTGIVSYAMKLGGSEGAGGMMVGANLKYIMQSIEEETATGIAGDLGFMFSSSGFSVGAAVQNIGTGMKFIEEAYSLPMNLKTGISYAMGHENRILISGEVNIPSYNDLYFSVGGEYTMKQLFSVRAGYNTANTLALGYTVGAGIKSGGFNLDYAWVPGSIGSAHRFSVNFKF